MIACTRVTFISLKTTQAATRSTQLASHTSGAGAVSYRFPQRIRFLITGTAVASAPGIYRTSKKNGNDMGQPDHEAEPPLSMKDCEWHRASSATK